MLTHGHTNPFEQYLLREIKATKGNLSIAEEGRDGVNFAVVVYSFRFRIYMVSFENSLEHRVNIFFGDFRGEIRKHK